jgi:hypothetical protein
MWRIQVIEKSAADIERIDSRAAVIDRLPGLPMGEAILTDLLNSGFGESRRR